MIDRARIRQFEESVGFVHLLQIGLQESSCYNAPKHGESGKDDYERDEVEERLNESGDDG